MLMQVAVPKAVKRKEYSHEELREAYKSLGIKRRAKIDVQVPLTSDIDLIEAAITYVCGCRVYSCENPKGYRVIADGYNLG